MAEDQGPFTIDADALLGTRAVEAGGAALAARNQHHLAEMDPEEREEAARTWHELAVAVLTAVRSAVAPGGADAPEGVGRAVIVLEDQADDEVAVHVTFTPQIEQLEDGSVAGTPAQLTAMSLLEMLASDLAGDAQGGDGQAGQPG